MRSPSLRKIACAPVDAAVLVGTVFAAFAIRFWYRADLIDDLTGLYWKAALLVVVTEVCLYYNDLYSENVPQPTELLTKITIALASAMGLLSVIYYLVPSVLLARGALLIQFALGCVALTLWRSLFYWAIGRDVLTRNLVILGTGEFAVDLARAVMASNSKGQRIVGFLGEDPALVGRSLFNPSVIGTLDDLDALRQRMRIDTVVVALGERRGRLPVESLMNCRAEGTRVEEASSFYERETGQVPVRSLRPSSFIFSRTNNNVRLVRAIKRAGDFCLALVGLVLALPLLVLAGLLIVLESGWPIFYKQERVGARGRSFVLYKLRTMRQDAEKDTGPVWAAATQVDPRISRVGALLRKTRLDELPQLINVLKGEMSFVGPRPERPYFVEQLKKAIPYYDARHSVRPGITGWAQTRFTYSSSVEETEKKLQYDLYYVKNMRLSLDILILFDTAKVVLLGKGAR